MYDDVLLPVDESTTDTVVLYHVAEIVNETGADVTVLSVADTSRDSVTLVDGDVVDALEINAEDVVDDAVDVLASLGVDASTDVAQGHPAATIVDYAERFEFDLVVMPTHGRAGVSRYLLGSVTEKVVRLSPIPVLTARMLESDDLTFPYERVLLAVDGSDAADRAADHAIDLAATLDATLHVINAVDTNLGLDVRSTQIDDDLDAAADDLVTAVGDRASERGVDSTVTHTERGRPGDTIVDYAEQSDVDAIVLGTTGRRGLKRILLGSVAEHVVRTAPVPVLTVRDA